MASEIRSAGNAPRLRAQWLDDKGKHVRIAFQASPDRAWEVEDARPDRLVRYWKLMRVEDIREWTEFDLRARAARREWGHEGGFAEWTPGLGTRRFHGDLLRAVDDWGLDGPLRPPHDGRLACSARRSACVLSV